MTSVEDVTQEDAKAWELLQQQRADAALAAKAAEEFASQARAQVGAVAVASLPTRWLHVWRLPCGSRWASCGSAAVGLTRLPCCISGNVGV